jgi:hypothetical protein
VMISKKMFRDKSLCPRTKGILGYLLCLPDDWETHPRQVAASLDVSKDQVYAALKEMIENGYATKKTIKGEKGRFSKVVYEFFEEKIEGFKKIDTVSEKPDTEKPDTEKPPLQKTNPTDPLPYTKTTTSKQGSGLSKERKEDKVKGKQGNSLQSIKISESDKRRLYTLYPEDLLDKVIKYVTDKSFKATKNLTSAIFYFCKYPENMNFKISQDDIDENKRIALIFFNGLKQTLSGVSEIQHFYFPDMTKDQITFPFGMSLKYEDHEFKRQLIVIKDFIENEIRQHKTT